MFKGTDIPYVVIGVRADGARRVLVDGLTLDHAENTAALIGETGIFHEVIVQPEVTVELFPAESPKATAEWEPHGELPVTPTIPLIL